MSPDTEHPTTTAPASPPAPQAPPAASVRFPWLRIPRHAREIRVSVRADELRLHDDLPLGRRLTRAVTRIEIKDIVLYLPWSLGHGTLLRIPRRRVWTSDGGHRTVFSWRRFTVLPRLDAPSTT